MFRPIVHPNTILKSEFFQQLEIKIEITREENSLFCFINDFKKIFFINVNCWTKV